MPYDLYSYIYDQFSSQKQTINEIEIKLSKKKKELKELEKNDPKNFTEIKKLKKEKDALDKNIKSCYDNLITTLKQQADQFYGQWKFILPLILEDKILKDKNSTFAKEMQEKHLKAFNSKKDRYSIKINLDELEKNDFIPKSDETVTKTLQALHEFSFFLHIEFRLATPFLSQDDEPFYLLDNPIKKDKVFKVPMVSGSTWKGNLRWAAGRAIELGPKDKMLDSRIQLVKLFGHENDAQKKYFDLLMPDKLEEFNRTIKGFTNRDGLRKGRLHFYPTFFDEMSLEVINPHDRKTKAGTVPIFIESVPSGASGIFSLLYVPFDMMGSPTHQIREEAKEDFLFLSTVLKDLMLTYGFSAKKSSGFGIIREPISEGVVIVKGSEPKGFSMFDDLKRDIDILFPEGD